MVLATGMRDARERLPAIEGSVGAISRRNDIRIKHRTMGLITAFALAAFAAGCGGGLTKQSTGERLADSVLSAKVKTALLKDGDVKGTSVNVESFKGTVQLSGFVRSEAERVRAGELARGIAGVDEVRNDLQVRGE